MWLFTNFLYDKSTFFDDFFGKNQFIFQVIQNPFLSFALAALTALIDWKTAKKAIQRGLV